MSGRVRLDQCEERKRKNMTCAVRTRPQLHYEVKTRALTNKHATTVLLLSLGAPTAVLVSWYFRSKTLPTVSEVFYFFFLFGFARVTAGREKGKAAAMGRQTSADRCGEGDSVACNRRLAQVGDVAEVECRRRAAEERRGRRRRLPTNDTHRCRQARTRQRSVNAIAHSLPSLCLH